MRVQVATKTTTVLNRFLCVNRGTSSDQYNSCTNESRCAQFGISDTQNIGCSNEYSCSQFGLSSTQNTVCANRSGCATNSGFDGPGTSQNTVCQSSICSNFGADTNVIANSASDVCANGGPNTTTICQKDRTFVFPNH